MQVKNLVPRKMKWRNEDDSFLKQIQKKELSAFKGVLDFSLST